MTKKIGPFEIGTMSPEVLAEKKLPAFDSSYWTGGRREVKFRHDFGEGDVEVWAQFLFRPERPAPRCSDPNAAAFSDPGDPAEVFMEKLTIDGRECPADLLSYFDGAVERAIEEAERCER